uniref:Uncharacterized protein n=1 Tax=Alexandrium catenella TaxID=2925 RepID=A0A7S1QQJ0_ALECA
MRFDMIKTCFGFSRRTLQGQNGTGSLMTTGALYYPIFQIVDGHGKRTEHWDAYMRFMNTVGRNCNHPDTTSAVGVMPCNLADGTMFTPVMTKRLIPKSDLAHGQVEYLRLFDIGRLAER